MVDFRTVGRLEVDSAEDFCVGFLDVSNIR
jgi:hypothetical protein